VSAWSSDRSRRSPTFVTDPAELLEDRPEIHHALAQLGPKSMGLSGVVIPLLAAGFLQNVSINILQVHDLDPRSVRGNERLLRPEASWTHASIGTSVRELGVGDAADRACQYHVGPAVEPDPRAMACGSGVNQ
jgi:hypothetical protein